MSDHGIRYNGGGGGGGGGPDPTHCLVHVAMAPTRRQPPLRALLMSLREFRLLRLGTKRLSSDSMYDLEMCGCGECKFPSQVYSDSMYTHDMMYHVSIYVLL